MSRSRKKLPYINLNFIKYISKIKQSNLPLEITQRASTITAALIGKTVRIHNGQNFVDLAVTENHVGFKFGQFAITKKRVIHKKKK